MSELEFGEISIMRGQAVDIEIDVPKEADLSIATIEFGVSIGPSDPYLFTLSTTVSGNTIKGTLEGSETLPLDKKTYYYSCWVIINDDATPVARGFLKLSDDLRNR